jgi:hypothetical protein
VDGVSGDVRGRGEMGGGGEAGGASGSHG